MSFKTYLNADGGSGNLNTKVAGTQTGGNKLVMDNVREGTLSCEFDITAATSTIQIFGEWQGSDDGSTWFDVRGQNNAAPVVISTGTAAIVKVVLDAPKALDGFRFGRAVVRNQVVTGQAGDLYAMKYRYQRTGF